MEDQHFALSQCSSNLLVQDGDYPVYPTAMSQEPNLWGPCLPGSSWRRYLAHVRTQVRFEGTEAANCYLLKLKGNAF